MTVNRENLEVGDLVFSDKNNKCYIILEVKKTCLHKHKWYKVFYLDDCDYINWYAHQLSPKKRIMRAINLHQKEDD